MYKIPALFALAILTACSSPKNPNETKNTTQQEAVALKDSAVKLMRQPVESKEFDESLNLLNAALGKNPQLKSAYFYKMKYYTAKGDDENAFRTLVESNAVNPGDAFSTLNIGIEYEKRDSLQKAKAKYTEAVALFENALDTINEKSALIRNTFIMNLALANTLAQADFDIESMRSELSEPERQNLDIALNTLKGMNRADLLNLQESQAGANNRH